MKQRLKCNNERQERDSNGAPSVLDAQVVYSRNINDFMIKLDEKRYGSKIMHDGFTSSTDLHSTTK